MAWFGSNSEWKQGLTSVVLGKVEDLENLAEKLKRDRNQNQTQLDFLQQSLEKQKRKTDEEIKLRQSIEKANEQLARSCEQLQEKLCRSSGEHNALISQVHLQKPESNILDPEAKKCMQERLDFLESENKILLKKIKGIPTKEGTSLTSVKASNREDFWSHFSQPQSNLSQISPLKTNFKKALETSEENPFKAPSVTSLKKGMEVSDESPFKTPQKYSSSVSYGYTENRDSYTQQLQKEISELKKELKEWKNQSSVSISNNENNQKEDDAYSLKTALELSKAELLNKENLLASLNEQLSAFKLKADETTFLYEECERKQKQAQTELDCQRQNSETCKKRLEDIILEKERELNSEASRSQIEIATLDKKITELTSKLHQQETLAMNNQNVLQASLDKLNVQLSSTEKEKILAQNKCIQLEASVNQFEKCEDGKKKLMTQLKQDKEMISAQVESLKVKLLESNTKVSSFQIQIEKFEQLSTSQKSFIEDYTSLKLSMEKENEALKLELQSLKNENIRISSESQESVTKIKNKLLSLESDISTITTEKCKALEELKATKEECEMKLSGVHSLEAAINKLEKEIKELKHVSSEKEACLLADIEKINNCKQIELSELRKSIAEIKELESLANGEKLAAQLTSWELEGKLDSVKKDLDSKSETLKFLQEKHNDKKLKLQQEIFSLEDSIISKNSTISSQETQICEMSKKCLDLTNTVALINNLLKELQILYKCKEEQLKDIELQFSLLQNEMFEKSASFDKLSSENESKAILIEEMSANFDSQLAAIRNELSNSKIYIDKLVLKIENSKVESKELKKLADLRETNYQNSLTELENDKLKCENDLQNLRCELVELTNKNQSAKLMEEMNCELSLTLNKNLEEKSNLIAQLEATITSLKCELAVLQYDKSTADETLTNKQNEFDNELIALSNNNKVLENLLNERACILLENERFIENLKVENANLIAVGNNLCDTMTSQTSSMDDLKIEYKNIKQNLEEIEHKFSQELLQSQNKTDNAKQITKELEEVKAKNSVSADKLKESENLCAELKNVILKLNLEKESLVEDFTKLKRQLETSLKELDVYSNKRIPDLEEKLKLTECHLAETERESLEIREEFDLKSKDFKTEVTTLKSMLIEKDETLSQLKSKYCAILKKSEENEILLQKEKLTCQDITNKYECYMEISKLMERENSGNCSEESLKILKENAALQDIISELKITVSKLGKQVYILQSRNQEINKTTFTALAYKDTFAQTDIPFISVPLETRLIGDEAINLYTKVDAFKEKEEKVTETENKIKENCVDLSQLNREKEEMTLTHCQHESSLSDQVAQLRLELLKMNKQKEEYENLVRESHSKLSLSMELQQENISMKEKLKNLEGKSLEAKMKIKHLQEKVISDEENGLIKSNALSELNAELIGLNHDLKGKYDESLIEREKLGQIFTLKCIELDDAEHYNEMLQKKISEIISRADLQNDQSTDSKTMIEILQKENSSDNCKTGNENKKEEYQELLKIKTKHLKKKRKSRKQGRFCASKNISIKSTKIKSEAKSFKELRADNLNLTSELVKKNEELKSLSIHLGEMVKSQTEKATELQETLAHGEYLSKKLLECEEAAAKLNEEKIILLNKISELNEINDALALENKCVKVSNSALTCELQDLKCQIEKLVTMCIPVKNYIEEENQFKYVEWLLKLEDFVQHAKDNVFELQKYEEECLKKSEEILKLNDCLQDFKAKLDVCALRSEDLTKDLNIEKLNHRNTCSKMDDALLSICRYKEDVAGLKVKFTTIQKNSLKKDKELIASLKINTAITEKYHELEHKMKEEEKISQKLVDEISELKSSHKSVEKELLMQQKICAKVLSNLDEREKNIQNLKQKISHLQIQVKKYQKEISKLIKKPILKKNLEEPVNLFCGFENNEHESTQSSQEVVVCSQSEGVNLSDVILPKSFQPLKCRRRSRKSLCRRLSKTTLSIIDKERKEKLNNSLKNPSPKIESSVSPKTILSTELDTSILSENLSSSTRRVTRLSLSRDSSGSISGVESKKRAILSGDFNDVKRLKLTNISNSTVEGLPSKTEKGLNDIPIGLESPGVMRRSTTPFRKINQAQMSPRGPLRLLDTNLSLIRPECLVKTDTLETPTAVQEEFGS